MARLRAYLAERRAMLWSDMSANMAEIIEEGESGDCRDVIRLEELDAAPAKLEDLKADVQDPLLEINLGAEEEHRPTYISDLLEPDFKAELILLLREYKDCFAWNYIEMPGLPRQLVEHRLPIKEGFRPFKQVPRRMSTEVTMKVKEEIERLLKAGFIRTTRYCDWLSNIVPVVKKNGKIGVCVDFRNLNLAIPKDEYPMPMADQLIDAAAKNEILSFMDGHSGYNQIFIVEDDVNKTAFRCPGAIGTFEWVVMPFGLKNAGATYQRAMNAIFHDMIGKFMEVYIDDVVVKSATKAKHLADLRRSFERMRTHGLKMNPLKCAFGVTAGNFLGFLVHRRGIEIDKNKARVIIDAQPPRNKKELQRLIGQITYLGRFISNRAGKIHTFSPLLKLKSEEGFRWEKHHQHVFESIKEYLANPPVLMPPRKKQPLKLYISAADESIGSLLAQDNEVGKEQAVYYLSRILTPVERRYTPIEKMCLALYFAAHKLRIYMLPVLVYVICATDLIKYMLSCPINSGRIGKWSLALMEFSFQYMPQRAVKGQALADFLADHPCLDVDPGVYDAMELCAIQLTPWTLIFDGSSANDAGGAGVVIIAPNGRKTTYSFFLDFKCSNNQAEYEALIIGLEILLEMGAQTVEIIGDSSLVIGQLSSNFKCQSWHLKPFHSIAMQLLQEFAEVKVNHVYRLHNKEANDLTQIASGVRVPEGIMENLIRIKRRSLPSVKAREELLAEVFAIEVEDDMEENDWRTPIVDFLKNPDPKADKKLKIRALKFVMIDGDLFRKSIKDDLLLRCVSKKEVMKVMGETHEGICGAHQAGIKMKWLIRRYAYYWPGMLKDCITYAKGCQACQRHGPIHRAPAIELQPIIKPWPFRGWAMDLIGKVYPPSSKQHCFIIVATDYFTKWVEAVPMKSVHQEDVIRFIKQHVIHRFGIPESITTDRGSALVAQEVQAFAAEYGIKLLNSTPHFAQGNGQAESSNKTLKGIIEKMVEDNPRV
ncbi:uncharacterized protein LOC132309293 [Cornus florida]|uniref:uncharacterized protein LOC132309293 n=1 Tax=Cornus florida TaxID=4283 RepID=UPI002897CE93|nr:uncharacterized protein LOC132309293 [Cornus florida]